MVHRVHTCRVTTKWIPTGLVHTCCVYTGWVFTECRSTHALLCLVLLAWLRWLVVNEVPFQDFDALLVVGVARGGLLSGSSLAFDNAL